MVEFIETHRDAFGVEPICRSLQVAPSTYYAVKSRVPSARALRDAVMIPILLALFAANYRVYGAHKLWKAARRAGPDIGRDQTARLMRRLGIRGVSRSRRVRTTVADDKAGRPWALTGSNLGPLPCKGIAAEDCTALAGTGNRAESVDMQGDSRCAALGIASRCYVAFRGVSRTRGGPDVAASTVRRVCGESDPVGAISLVNKA
jgi:transposase InsO family protein